MCISLRLVRRMSGVAVLLSLATAVTPLWAGAHSPEPSWRDDDHSYDRARRAVSRGESLPLSQVLAHLHRKAPGQIVATEYEFEFDRWVYEFKIIDPQGRLRKVHLDAKTGDLVQMSDD